MELRLWGTCRCGPVVGMERGERDGQSGCAMHSPEKVGSEGSLMCLGSINWGANQRPGGTCASLWTQKPPHKLGAATASCRHKCLGVCPTPISTRSRGESACVCLHWGLSRCQMQNAKWMQFIQRKGKTHRKTTNKNNPTKNPPVSGREGTHQPSRKGSTRSNGHSNYFKNGPERPSRKWIKVSILRGLENRSKALNR